MKARLVFLLRYYLLWLCLFIIAKLVFLLYQHSQSFSISPGVWLAIFFHGVKLDLSAAGYFTLVPALLLLLASFSNPKPVSLILHVYTLLLIVIFLLITLVDMEAYKYWGARLDSSPLRFLVKPKETLASSSFMTLTLYVASFLLLSWMLFRIYRKHIAAGLINSGKAGLTGMLSVAFIIGLLFLSIRGGWGVSPINTGSVYFSRNAFANHAAVNVIWNFGHSLLEGKETNNPYIISKATNYDARLKELYQFGEDQERILNNTRPNILLLILESFSAKLIEPLGGKPGITPEFNALCKDGILFSRIYSTDSRTDKGLATIISGYPVLEAIPILKYPEKTQHLPFLSSSLIEEGYHATFMYGGDVDFANMRSYLVNGNFSRITSADQFPASMRTGKWGVPDHFVFDRFLEDVKADTGRWFKVMLTLTNHEPFEIPVKPKYGDRNLTEKFYSSAFYADSCLGDFIRRFKEAGLWENTLIIMVADHGTRLPDFDDIFEPRKHHIPLLLTGGAVKKDSVVTKVGSQADLAVTLLHQMGIPTHSFILGKDLLSPSSQSFAFYSLKNGIAMLTDTSGFGYDFTTHDYSFTYGRTDTSHMRIARSLQQYVFEHYLRLSAH